MSAKLPALTGTQVISLLEKFDFRIVRRKGSHVRLRHADGRVVTVPLHAGKDLGRGILRKILRDAELSAEDVRAPL